VDAPTFRFVFSGYGARVRAKVIPTEQARPLDCAYCAPADAGGATAGAIFPFHGKLAGRLALGAVAHIPGGPLVSVKTADPARPSWYRLDRRGRLSIVTGLGLKLAHWISVGAGAQVLADLRGTGVALNLNSFSKQVRFREVDSYISAVVTPTAGLSLTPTSWLKLGVGYRSEMAVYYVIPASIELEGLANMGFSVSGLKFFTPHTIDFGATFKPSESLTLSLSGQYAFWSRAPDPYVQVLLDLSGETLQALGLGNALDIQSERTRVGFADTLSVRAGIEWAVSSAWTLRAGGFLRPTPVPKQDGPATNLLDGTQVGGALGLGVRFRDPGQWFENMFAVDLGSQALYSLPRTAQKDATDVVPPYEYQAIGIALALSLSYAY
jgi:hypothetical protein